jgi:hypothetical protein
MYSSLADRYDNSISKKFPKRVMDCRLKIQAHADFFLNKLSKTILDTCICELQSNAFKNYRL